MICTEEEYKGHAMLSIKKDEDDRYPFSFGLGKAKKILASLKQINEFVEKHDNEPKPED